MALSRERLLSLQFGRLLIEDDPPEPKARQVDFIGQEPVKEQLRPFLKQPIFPPTLLLGEPGIGKTRLARHIAGERQVLYHEIMAPVDALPGYGLVFIDEVHRQRHPEPLYRYMEQGIPAITAATTKPEMLDSAFRSRFLLVLHLRPYPDDEIAEIMAFALDVHPKDVGVLAHAAAGNPRQAERITLTAKALGTLDPNEVLSVCRITADGLTEFHIDYLATLDFTQRPMGISQLATLLNSDQHTVRETERLLLALRLVDLRPNGRALTRKGRAYLAAVMP